MRVDDAGRAVRLALPVLQPQRVLLNVPEPRRPSWIRRIGLLGFLFFLLKGLAWLIVPALLAGGLAGL